MLLYDLVAIADWHAEGRDDGTVRGMEQSLELGVAPAFDQVDVDKRHDLTPPSPSRAA
jgi:hypothetical protein